MQMYNNQTNSIQEYLRELTEHKYRELKNKYKTNSIDNSHLY